MAYDWLIYILLIFTHKIAQTLVTSQSDGLIMPGINQFERKTFWMGIGSFSQINDSTKVALAVILYYIISSL